MSTKSLQKYIRKIERLRIDKAHGDSPHKPILLLAVIELIEQGQICENMICFSPNLAETAKQFWVVVPERTFNIAMPFFHLKSDGFWHLHANEGYESKLSRARKLKAVSRIHELISHVTLDDELFVLLADAGNREIIRQTLICTYFSDFQDEFGRLITEGQEIWTYTELLLTGNKLPSALAEPPPLVPRMTRIRKAGFRRAIMGMYNYTCAVCKLRIVTANGESATDAAHIIPYHVWQHDNLRNGVSLCKLHHWAFDQGLISFSNSHRIVVSRELSEQKPTEWMLTKLGKKRIQLPKRVQHYPAQDAMAWHRENVFENNFIK